MCSHLLSDGTKTMELLSPPGNSSVPFGYFFCFIWHSLSDPSFLPYVLTSLSYAFM